MGTKETDAGKRKWNTENLALRIGVDALAAGVAGALVAPIITTIDKGIIENASGKRTLRESVKSTLGEMFRTPMRFFGGRPFGLVFLLYTGTYLTANLTDTLTSTLHSHPASTVSPGLPKFAATSAANLSLCLYKDSQFTKLFASTSASSSSSSKRTHLPPISTAKPRIPLPTLFLFTARDMLTIFASFNLPSLLTPRFNVYINTFEARWVRMLDAGMVAQFVVPAAVQVVSTPLHLWGLDLYNRPNVGWEKRVGRVVRDWGVSVCARMGRIVPAFGVGGVVNGRCRGWGMRGVEGRGGG
ncbi:hypothetical protein M011DRAFT_400274 [Sporormia fimetaria CBS 119925]|uniref:Mitochondrial carrier n=1 Tax=Sporormia fimetaria CBS 119925 TaxID=1340428 RepID=A0A6A6VDX1_9PLEO|nr:hypothetical protein M011DRAFT_400274 [Sporormia fimetaria CBS 119925]